MTTNFPELLTIDIPDGTVIDGYIIVTLKNLDLLILLSAVALLSILGVEELRNKKR